MHGISLFLSEMSIFGHEAVSFVGHLFKEYLTFGIFFLTKAPTTYIQFSLIGEKTVCVVFAGLLMPLQTFNFREKPTQQLPQLG